MKSEEEVRRRIQQIQTVFADRKSEGVLSRILILLLAFVCLGIIFILLYPTESIGTVLVLSLLFVVVVSVMYHRLKRREAAKEYCLRFARILAEKLHLLKEPTKLQEVLQNIEKHTPDGKTSAEEDAIRWALLDDRKVEGRLDKLLRNRIDFKWLIFEVVLLAILLIVVVGSEKYSLFEKEVFAIIVIGLLLTGVLGALLIFWRIVEWAAERKMKK